jgi:hypothetical protein
MNDQIGAADPAGRGCQPSNFRHNRRQQVRKTSQPEVNMRKPLSLRVAVVALLGTLAPAQADQRALEDLQVRFAAQPYMDGGDIEAVELRIATYHHLPEDIANGYAGQRTLFSMFAVSDPRVDKLTQDWLREKPDSPYALTARAWYLWNRGGLARGQDLTRYTYRAAFDSAARHLSQAMDLGMRAYAIAPDLVGASDVVILTSMHVRGPKSADQIVAEVMTRTPNRSTLVRAAIAKAPRWGGSIEAIFDLCDRYAAQVPGEPGYSADVCKADLVHQANTGPDEKATVGNIVAASDHPRLAKARLERVMRLGDQSPEMQRRLETYLFDETVTDTDAADYLDSWFYRPQQRPLTFFDVYSRKIDKARADLAHDPYNPDLIDTILIDDVNGRIFGEPRTDAERRGLYRRALTYAPYNAGQWSRYASFVSFEAGDPAAANPFYENAIVYSNHRPHMAGRYADFLAMVWSSLQYPPQPDAGPASTPASTPARTAAEDAEILCPLVRAARIYLAQCPGGPADACSESYDPQGWIEAITAAQGNDICAQDFALDPDSLTFEEHVIDWANLPSHAAPGDG